MQNQFYNQPAVEWAKRNLQKRVEIKPFLSSRLGKILSYLLVFIVPLAFIIPGIVLKISGYTNKDDSASAILLCGFVLLIPFGTIALIGIFTQGKIAKSLDADGVNLSSGQNFSWEKLHCIDHVSKTYRVNRFAKGKIKDNQIELVFENGKVIIPPLIYNREQIWDLINSMPVQVRDDGVIREQAA